MPVKRHLEILAQDLRYAARGLQRTPRFTHAAVFAMAHGAGGAVIGGLWDDGAAGFSTTVR